MWQHSSWNRVHYTLLFPPAAHRLTQIPRLAVVTANMVAEHVAAVENKQENPQGEDGGRRVHDDLIHTRAQSWRCRVQRPFRPLPRYQQAMRVNTIRRAGEQGDKILTRFDAQYLRVRWQHHFNPFNLVGERLTGNGDEEKITLAQVRKCAFMPSYLKGFIFQRL